MRNLVESILNKDYTKANDHLHEELKIIVARKLLEAKKMLTAKMYTEQLNVDNMGNFHEPTGYIKKASIEKAERGLAEEDNEEKPKKESTPKSQRFLRALTGEKYTKPKLTLVKK